MANAFTLFGSLSVDTKSFEGSLVQANQKLLATRSELDKTERSSTQLGLTSATTARAFERVNEQISTQRDRLVQAAVAFQNGAINSTKFASAVRGVDSAINGLNSKLRDTQARLKDIESASQSGKGSGGGQLLTGIGAGAGLPIGAPAAAIAAITAAAVAGGKSILDYSSKLEQARIGFTTMTGSATIAQKHLEDLQKFAATTPFQFAELVDASQKLQGIGFKAQQVIPILTDVGNALAAAGRLGDLPFAVKALSDIQAKGKLAGQEIIQLANAGIPIRDVLAKELKISTAEVVALGEKGGISADVVFKALHHLSTERFGDAMVQQSKTFGGAMSNIEDAVAIASAKAFAPFYEQISKLAVQAGDDVTKQGSDFTSVGVTIGEYIAQGVGIGVEKLAENLPEIIAKIVSRGITSGGGAIPIGKGIGTALLKSSGFSDDDIKKATEKSAANGKAITDALYKGLLAAANPIGFANQGASELINKAFGNTDFKAQIIGPSGDVTFLDPVTNTIKTISKEIANVPSLAVAINATKAAEDAQKVADIISNSSRRVESQRIVAELELRKLQNETGENKIQNIRKNEAAELSALEKQINLAKEFAARQIRNLSPEDLAKGKDIEIRGTGIEERQKLETEQTIVRIKARREEQAEIKKTVAALDELQKKQIEAVLGVAANATKDNPIAHAMLEGEKAVEKLKESLKGLPPALIASQLALLNASNGADIFGAKLDSALSSINLRSQADKFRGPTTSERQQAFNDRTAEFLRTSNSTNPDVITQNIIGALKEGLLSKQDALKDLSGLANSPDAFKQLRDIVNNTFTREQQKTQSILDKQFQAAGGAKTDLEKAKADRAITNLASSLNPEDIRKDQREQIVNAFERRADREDRFYVDSLQYQKDTKDAVLKIKEFTDGQKDAAKQGVDLNINLKDDTSDKKLTSAKAATPADVSGLYNGGRGFDANHY